MKGNSDLCLLRPARWLAITGGAVSLGDFALAAWLHDVLEKGIPLRWQSVFVLPLLIRTACLFLAAQRTSVWFDALSQVMCWNIPLHETASLIHVFDRYALGESENPVQRIVPEHGLIPGHPRRLYLSLLLVQQRSICVRTDQFSLCSMLGINMGFSKMWMHARYFFPHLSSSTPQEWAVQCVTLKTNYKILAGH